jgi:hypothetical protein
MTHHNRQHGEEGNTEGDSRSPAKDIPGGPSRSLGHGRDRRFLVLSDRGDEAITTCWNRLDELLAIVAVAECFAKCGHRIGEVRLLNERVRPNRAQKLLFDNQAPMPLRQVEQQVERLGGQRDGLPCSQ